MTPRERMKLDTEYDYVAVIDFLPDEDRKRWRECEKLITILPKGTVVCHYVNTRTEFDTAFGALAEDTRAGNSFLLHLNGHADEDGLSLASKEVVPWSEFATLLGRFSTDQLRSLVINASCCHGLHTIKSMRSLKSESSFFGVVGPAQKINFPKAISITKRFYKKLLKNREINEIVREINNEMSGSYLYCITGQGFHELDKLPIDNAQDDGRSGALGSSSVLPSRVVDGRDFGGGGGTE